MSINHITLIGRITRDVESQTTPQGHTVAKFAIAVDRITKDENGQKETDFFDIVAWRRTGEFAAQYLGKGRLVAVEGRLQTRNWVAQDGTKRKSFEILAENLQGLDRAKEEGEAAPAETPVRRPAPRPAAAATDDDQDHDPFALDNDE
jgi:single-strand DNA-binding protein